MAVQIYRQPGLGEMLGLGLGQGIEESVDRYLQQKQQEKEQQQKLERSRLFSQLAAGIPTEQLVAPQGEQPQAAPQLTRDQQLQMAAELGYSPAEIAQLEKIYSGREKEELQREGLRIREEAPERKIVTEEAKKIRDRARTADQKIADYKSLKKLAESGELRTGYARQLLDRFGLAGFWQQPASDVAEKLIGDINLASLTDVSTPGRVTARMLEQIAKTNPSLMMTDDGMKYTADVRIIGEKIQKQINAELNKIKQENKGKPLPLDAVDKAIDRAQPKINALHKKQQNLVEKIIEQKQPQKKLFDTLPDASKYKGKRIQDTETGKILTSDGSNWLPII